MTKNDLTAEMLFEYMKEGLLTEKEKLSVRIPCPKHEYGIERGIFLKDLIYNFSSNGFFNISELDPKNIESMVLFGSMLYRHNPERKVVVSEERQKRKYGFFGPKETIPAKIEYYPEFPKDFKIMVLTRNSVNDKEIIIPENEIINNNWIFPLKLHDKEKFPYKTFFETLVYESRFNNSPDYHHQYFGWNLFKNEGGVHVSYRSIEQFLKGIGDRDSHSREAFMHGVPFLGEQSFLKIIRDIDSLKREPLHSHTWTFSRRHPSVKIN